MKFQSENFKSSSSWKTQNCIFKRISDIQFYFLLCREAGVTGNNTALSSSLLSSHRSPQVSLDRKAHSLQTLLIITARLQGRKMEGILQVYCILPLNKTE